MGLDAPVAGGANDWEDGSCGTCGWDELDELLEPPEVFSPGNLLSAGCFLRHGINLIDVI